MLFGEEQTSDGGDKDGPPPCPLCGREPAQVLPAHAISITASDDIKDVCIVYGGLLGVPGMVVIDHDSGEASVEEEDIEFNENEAVDIGFGED